MQSTKRTEIENGVATIIINNPEKRNCLDVTGADQFGQVCAEAAENDAAKVIVLRGAGGKAFSAGADLSSVVDSDDIVQAVLDMAAAIDRMTSLIAAIRKPVIAAIEGVCLGGGLQIAAAADIRLASQSAVMGIPAIQRGFIASPAGIARLIRLVGAGATKLLLLEGGMWRGDDALAKGLFDIMVPKEEFDEKLGAFSKSMAALDGTALAASKRMVDTLSSLDDTILADLQKLHDKVNSNEKIRETLAEFSKRKA